MVKELGRVQQQALTDALSIAQEAVKVLLAAPAIKPKAKAIDDMTALHFAAQNGHAEICRLLITAGAPVNSKTRKQVTPLHLACQKGHAAAVKLLLKRRASPFNEDKKGENALAKCSSDSIRCACCRFPRHDSALGLFSASH
jgi:ankyrin repeat protein